MLSGLAWPGPGQGLTRVCPWLGQALAKWRWGPSQGRRSRNPWYPRAMGTGNPRDPFNYFERIQGGRGWGHFYDKVCVKPD